MRLINQALEEAVEVNIPINEQVNGRKRQVSNNIIQPVSFGELFSEEYNSPQFSDSPLSSKML